ncbi:SPOR domain-containing protein [Hydrogenovibrio halophilus]|uniref:SPOR domain-containing protein n=1 Tax=Hydrogenovibrio halophilus TaxID=373391 RepID=UPI00037E2EEA|nr:SPOR domain-containing protein [Hydrogenovibrio halophilus]
MAQTISEFEKERAELLKAIEDQAQQRSSERGPALTPGSEESTDARSEHSLSDWLQAAEDVMPAREKKPQSAPSRASQRTKSQKVSFFGVIIMLSLLFTILGVLYIGYTSIHNELQKVVESVDGSRDRLAALEVKVADVEKAAATGGQSEVFTQLQQQVATLEEEVANLKAAQQALDHSVTDQANTLTQFNSSDGSASAQTGSQVVTIDILEQKLREHSRGIESKLETLITRLAAQSDGQAEEAAGANTDASAETASEDEATIAEPASPEVSRLNQPVIRLIGDPSSPKKPQAPKKEQAQTNQSDLPEPIRWLKDAPAENYTLQLASMSDQRSVKRIVEQKGLEGAKVIPLTRNGERYFVLLSGRYASRDDADQAAERYKQQFDISPWVRRVQDIRSKLE